MTVPADDDSDNRARSIFEQLRAAQESPPAGEDDVTDGSGSAPEPAFAAPEADVATSERVVSPEAETPGEAEVLGEHGGSPAEARADDVGGHPAEEAPPPQGFGEGSTGEDAPPLAPAPASPHGFPEVPPVEAVPPPVPGTDPGAASQTPETPAPLSEAHGAVEAPAAEPGPATVSEEAHERTVGPVPVPEGVPEDVLAGAALADLDTPLPASRPTRPLPRIIAVANQKGGVGKTTTAVNLGASLAELGHRVLVVDLDPQGNATTGLGINSRNLERSIYDVILHDTAMEDCIEPTALRNLFVAPATIDLAGAEIELVPAFSRELRLRRALERIEGDFDFTLIDCPPSLGLLTINGLAAAHEVLVPIQCEYYALEGLGQLLRNVTLVQGNLNPRLEVSNIVLTMYDARTRLAEQVAQEVREHFGPTVCRNVVPRTVRLSEAPSFGQPIIVFDPSSRGSIAYRELAKEVVGGTS